MMVQARPNGHEQPHPAARLNDTWDDLFQACWRRNECWQCLREEPVEPCGWCPSSGTCVPNTYRPSILGPMFNANICPLESERWELRTRPLGCHVSTITFLTCIISVLSTFVVIGAVAVGVKFTRWFIPRWNARPADWWRVSKYYQPGWWRGWRMELIDIPRARQVERSPLLA